MSRIFREAVASVSGADGFNMGFEWPFGIGVAVVVLAGIALVIYFTDRYRKRQFAIEDRLEARRSAIRVYNEMGSLINTWHEKAKFLPVEFDIDLAQLPPNLRRQYEDRRSEIIGLVEGASRMHSAVSRESLDPRVTDRHLTAQDYDAMANRFLEVTMTYKKAGAKFVELKQNIEDDVDRYSFEDQQERLVDLQSRLNTVRHLFNDFVSVFEVSQQRTLIDFLARRLDQAEGLLSLRQEQERTFRILEDAELDIVGLEAEAKSHADVAQVLRDPRQHMLEVIASARKQLKKFKRINTHHAEVALNTLQSYAESSIGQLRPRRSAGDQANFIKEFDQSVTRVVDEVAAADTKRREEERRSFSYGSDYRRSYTPSDDDLLAAGVITYVLASSDNDSSSSPVSAPSVSYDSGSSSSDSSSDFGSSSGGDY